MFDAHSVNFTIVYSFTSLSEWERYGGFPSNRLLQARDGCLYGTSRGGGLHKVGHIFRLDPSTGTLDKLYHFNWEEGRSPLGKLLQTDDGNFYGTTEMGGSENCASGCGTIFRLSPQGHFTTLHFFGGGHYGFRPCAGLIRARDGYFYGTTLSGGAVRSYWPGGAPNGHGTVFRLSLDGHLTIVHAFELHDGGGPCSELIEGRDGYLYGTTRGAGLLKNQRSGQGTIFRLSLDGNLTTLHTFDGEDGSGVSGVIQARDGHLYGTTAYGGFYNRGTIFRHNLESGLTSTLHSFRGTDGSGAETGVIQARDGCLYGTTRGIDRANALGTIFRITPDGRFSMLYIFYVETSSPWTGLVEAGDGYLYGSTIGNDDYGAKIYRITPGPTSDAE